MIGGRAFQRKGAPEEGGGEGLGTRSRGTAWWWSQIPEDRARGQGLWGKTPPTVERYTHQRFDGQESSKGGSIQGEGGGVGSGTSGGEGGGGIHNGTRDGDP